MRKIKKAILSLSLVAAMVMGEAGVALAAEPNQTTGDIEISEDVSYEESINLDKATAAVITSLNTTWNREGYLYIDFSGSGCKFDVKINDKLFKTIDNSGYADEYNPAPSVYYLEEKFYDVLFGGTYKVEITPYLYTENGPVAGEARSTTVSVPALEISSIWYYSRGEQKQNGYQKATGIQVSWSDSSIAGTQYELQRKEGKGAWKTITKTISTSYMDNTAVMGKKYQYRVRYVGGKNDYGQVPAGKWTTEKNVAVNVGSVDMSASYEGVGKGVAIGVYCNENLCSGYEIYRSTKKTKGYKKLATITGTSYEDKKVKNGTYYYKARAYYYDEETGKVYYGEYTEPKCVKLILGDIYAWAKQTGKNQATLEWNPVKGVSSYEVWYKSGMVGDAYKLYKTTTGTKLKVSGLSNDTGYSFIVRAKKKGSSYYTSNDCSCYIGFQAPSPIITKAKVTSNKAKTALTIKTTIKWDRIYGAKKIRIVGVKYGYDSNGNYSRTEKVLKTLKGTATTYTFTTKITTKSKGYDDIQVVAVKGKDERAGYMGSYRKLLETKKLNVKRANNAGSVVSWKAVVGATGYDVYRTSPYGYRMYIGSTDKCTYKDLNVTPGVQYTYQIVATNTKLNIWSNYYATVVKTYTHKLGKTKVKSATNSAAKTATITWKKVDYASSYTVYRATSKNGKYKKVATVKNGKTTYTDKKLKKGTTYYYKVKATGKNAAGLTVSSVLSVSKSVKVKK